MTFNKDFFNGLGETLTKTAKDISEKASNVYETQKIRSRISSEERTIEKLKNDIGSLVFSRFEAGEQPGGELGRLCQDIAERMSRIDALEKENASIKGKKICPSCRREVPMEAMFCPSCGTPCPNPDPEPEPAAESDFKADPEYAAQEDVNPFEDFEAQAEEAAQGVSEAVENIEEAAGEFGAEVQDAAGDAFDELKESAEETLEEAGTAAGEFLDEAEAAAGVFADHFKETEE